MADDFVEQMLTEWGFQHHVQTFRGNVFWVNSLGYHIWGMTNNPIGPHRTQSDHIGPNRTPSGPNRTPSDPYLHHFTGTLHLGHKA